MFKPDRRRCCRRSLISQTEKLTAGHGDGPLRLFVMPRQGHIIPDGTSTQNEPAPSRTGIPVQNTEQDCPGEDARPGPGPRRRSAPPLLVTQPGTSSLPSPRPARPHLLAPPRAAGPDAAMAGRPGSALPGSALQPRPPRRGSAVPPARLGRARREHGAPPGKSGGLPPSPPRAPRTHRAARGRQAGAAAAAGSGGGSWAAARAAPLRPARPAPGLPAPLPRPGHNLGPGGFPGRRAGCPRRRTSSAGGVRVGSGGSAG